jgi:hypothetical protein
VYVESQEQNFVQNLKLTLFFLEDLGGMILIVSTKKKTYQIIFFKKMYILILFKQLLYDKIFLEQDKN